MTGHCRGAGDGQVTRTPRERRLALVRTVAEAHGCTLADVMGRSRAPDVVMARWLAMALLRREFGDSLRRIGRLFGRDSSTVLHGLRRIGDDGGGLA